MNELVKYDAVKRSLAEIYKVDEVKSIRDKAIAYEAYARQARDSEMERQSCEIRLRAERRAGELLLKMKRDPISKGGDGKKKAAIHRDKPLSEYAAAIEQSKISITQAQRWQALAEVPQEQFEAELADPKKPTTSAIIKKVLFRKSRKAKNRKREEESVVEISDKKLWTLTKDQKVIKCDAVITDPPYGILDESWEPDELESFTCEWLERWNECGADFFLIFWSQRYLFDGKDWIDEFLSNYAFQQLLVWHYPNNKSPQSRKGFKQTYEPIFFYRRKDSTKQIGVGGSNWGAGLNDFDCHVAAVPQSNFNDAEMKQHPAQKSVSVMRWLVNAATQSGDLIIDPFCGSGTTGIAASQLGRKFYGIEINDEYRKLAEQRIAAYGV